MLKQIGASFCVWEVYSDREGSRTKSKSQLRGAHLQLASKKGDSLKWFWESRTQDSEQIQRSQWLDPRNQNSSILYFTPSLFHSLFFDGLTLTTLFLKATTPSEGVQATCPRVLYPEGISNKERKDWRHQSSRVFPEWYTSDLMCSPNSAILAGPWGPMIEFTWSCGPDPEAHMIVNFLQNYILEVGERQSQRKWLGDSLGHERVCDDSPTPPPPHSEEL